MTKTLLQLIEETQPDPHRALAEFTLDRTDPSTGSLTDYHGVVAFAKGLGCPGWSAADWNEVVRHAELIARTRYGSDPLATTKIKWSVQGVMNTLNTLRKQLDRDAGIKRPTVDDFFRDKNIPMNRRKGRLQYPPDDPSLN